MGYVLCSRDASAVMKNIILTFSITVNVFTVALCYEFMSGGMAKVVYTAQQPPEVADSQGLTPTDKSNNYVAHLAKGR